MALPGNLLSENAEGIETDASAWTTGSGTFERDTSRAHSGVASLRLTSAGPGDTWVYSNGDLTGLTPGTTYTVYVWAYTTISGLVAQVGLDWRNSSGTYLSSYASPSVPLIPNQWTQVGPFQTTAPANAAMATLYLAWFTATASGQTVWFDDIYLGIPPAVTPKDLADAGAGGEALSAVVAVPLADAGAAADTLGVTALVEVVEAGAGVEAPAAAATVPLGEAGAGVGVLDALPGPDLGEAGEASDALGVAASTVLGDAGAATEGVDVARLIGLVDTGAAADALLAGEVVEHLLADAGAAADALGVAAAVELADAGAGVEAAAVDVLVPLVEAAAGVDAVTSGVQVLLGDAAAGGDALGVAATRNIGPAGRPRRRWEIAAPLGWVFRGPRTRRARR